MDLESKNQGYGGGLNGTGSIGRFLLDADADVGGLSGGGSTRDGGDLVSSQRTSTETPDTSARARPQVDLSGVSPADLAAVPDLSGGDDDGVPASSAATSVTPATPAATPTPADPNIAASRAVAQPAATGSAVVGVTPVAEENSIRAAAQYYGMDLSQFQDDGQAFAHLVRQAQQGQANDYYAQLGRSLAPQHQQIQQFLASQAAPKPAEPERPAYLGPEFDQRWLAFVDRDETTGVFKPKPGYDPAIAAKVNAYSEWREGYNLNPMQHIQQAVQFEARKIAQDIVREQFNQQAQTQTIGQIMERNAPWLYQANEQGQRYVDGQGRFVASPAGARYQHHVAALGQAGVRDAVTLDRLAQQLVRAEFPQTATPAVAATTSPAVGGAQVARPNVNAAQIPNTAARIQAPASAPDTAGMSLYQMLQQDLRAGGVTDDDVARSHGDTYAR